MVRADMKALLPPALGILLLGSSAQGAEEITTEEVTYPAGRVKAQAYFASPKAKGPHPGVLVIHERWGHNDYARKRAEMLAELGYAALAVDMFGDGRKAHDPRGAATLVLHIRNHQPELATRFRAALNYLREREENDPEKIAAVGFDFGGDVCLQMARNGTVGLDGVAAFHCGLKVRSPNPPISELKARILVLHGEEDVYTPPKVVESFKKTMKDLKADLKFVAYPGAMHGFANPEASKIGEKFNIPHVYHPAAAKASWAELRTFLQELWEDPAE